MNRLAIFCVLGLAVTAPVAAGGYETLSPFTGVRWVGEQPEVEFEGAWYRPISIAGKPLSDILAFAKKRWPGKWQKRFAEDLVEVLSEMGTPPGQKVDLVLVATDSGKRMARKGAAMTKENRRRIWKAASSAGASSTKGSVPISVCRLVASRGSTCTIAVAGRSVRAPPSLSVAIASIV